MNAITETRRKVQEAREAALEVERGQGVVRAFAVPPVPAMPAGVKFWEFRVQTWDTKSFVEAVEEWFRRGTQNELRAAGEAFDAEERSSTEYETVFDLDRGTWRPWAPVF